MATNARQIIEKMEQAVQRGNHGYAIELGINFLRLDPKALDIRKVLRAAQRKAVQEQSARQASGLVLAFQSLLPTIQMRIALLLKKPEAALENCERILCRQPAHRSALLAGGSAARALGDVPTSLFFYETLLESNPGHPVALRELAGALEAGGNPKAALEALQRLKGSGAAPYDIDKWMRDLEAKVSMQTQWKPESGSFTDAVRDMDKQRDLDAESQTIRTEEDVERAIERIRRQADAEPGEIRHPISLVDLLLRKEDWAGALAALERARAINPQDFRIEERRVRCLLEPLEAGIRLLRASVDPAAVARREALQKDLAQKGAECYRRLVSMRPTDQMLRFRLGEFLAETGELEPAIREFQSAEADPRLKRDALRRLGECWIRKGEPSLAVKTLQRAIEGIQIFDEKDKEVLYLLGAAHESGGERSMALELFLRLQEMDIGFRDVTKRVAALRVKG
ncbi:MAG: tetratricopeptide repeat protein [Planctomycetota bacterium]